MTDSIVRGDTVIVDYCKLGLFELHVNPIYTDFALDIPATEASVRLSSLENLSIGRLGYHYLLSASLDENGFVQSHEIISDYDPEDPNLDYDSLEIKTEVLRLPLLEWCELFNIPEEDDERVSSLLRSAGSARGLNFQLIFGFLYPGLSPVRREPRLRATTKKKDRLPGKLYLVRLSEGLYKIGFSTNVKGRVESFKTMYPGCALLKTAKVESISVEMKVHKELKKLYDSERELYRTDNSESLWNDALAILKSFVIC